MFFKHRIELKNSLFSLVGSTGGTYFSLVFQGGFFFVYLILVYIIPITLEDKESQFAFRF